MKFEIQVKKEGEWSTISPTNPSNLDLNKAFSYLEVKGLVNPPIELVLGTVTNFEVEMKSGRKLRFRGQVFEVNGNDYKIRPMSEIHPVWTGEDCNALDN